MTDVISDFTSYMELRAGISKIIVFELPSMR